MGLLYAFLFDFLFSKSALLVGTLSNCSHFSDSENTWKENFIKKKHTHTTLLNSDVLTCSLFQKGFCCN